MRDYRALKVANVALITVGLLLSLSFTVLSQPYTWTTIAGLAGVSGSADGTNSAARFNYPEGLALDSAGNLYVANEHDHTIRQMTPVGPDWVVTTVAGMPGVAGSADGTNSNARFNYPHGVAVDTAGNLFVTDEGNHAVRQIARVGTNWVVTTVANGFGLPLGIAISAGNLYVADQYGTIRMITPVGTNWVVTTVAHGLASPWGITVDSAGNLFVMEPIRVWKFVPAGTSWVGTVICSLPGVTATDIALDNAGDLYVSTSSCWIDKITPAGTNWVISTIGGNGQSGSTDGTGGAARFSLSYGITSDGNGTVYVGDSANQTIRMGRFRPQLQTSLSGNQLLLSWPLAASNFVLETSGTLSADASWRPLTDGIRISNGNFVLTNDTHAATAFYRLRE